MESFFSNFLTALDELEFEFDELNSIISRVEVASDSKLYSFYYKQFVRISPIVNFYKKYKGLLNEIEDAKKSLIKFENEMEIKPKFKCIICGLWDAVVKDPKTGIYIIPITALKN